MKKKTCYPKSRSKKRRQKNTNFLKRFNFLPNEGILFKIKSGANFKPCCPRLIVFTVWPAIFNWLAPLTAHEIRLKTQGESSFSEAQWLHNYFISFKESIEDAKMKKIWNWSAKDELLENWFELLSWDLVIYYWTCI